jgi:hypothetical protein
VLALRVSRWSVFAEGNATNLRSDPLKVTKTSETYTMKQAGQTLVSGVASVPPGAAAGPRRFPTTASVSVEAVITSSDETVCCTGTSWQLLESDKTLTVRSQGLARIGWVWGLFCAALGCAITVYVYFANKCSGSGSGSGSSSSSSSSSQCDQAGTLVAGLSLSILLGLVIAMLPRGCSKHVTVETHDKSDVKHLTLAHVDTPFCCCETLNRARFNSSFKDRVLEFRYRAPQIDILRDVLRRCTGELPDAPSSSY